MKQSVRLSMFAIVFLSLTYHVQVLSYAFVHGKNSELDDVNISIAKKPIKTGYDIETWHKNVKRGNQGRGAEWNWADIKKSLKVDRGGPIYFTIYPNTRNHYRYSGQIPSDGTFGFVVKKVLDPKTNREMYQVVPDNGAQAEYKPAK